MSVEVISVHFPKAAGTSLRRSLLAAYGNDAVYFDYADDPADPLSPYNLDPERYHREARELVCASGSRVVHGHFHPSKYDFIDNAKRITFLRHPVDNLISIYYFWRTSDSGHSLFNYFRNSQLTLTDLARLPAMRYLLSRTYFGGFDMTRFDFIGFVENYAEDLQTLSRVLSIPLVETRENINKYAGYQEEINAIKADQQVISTLYNYLLEDIKFYERIKVRRLG